MFNQFRYLIADLKRWRFSTYKDLFYLIFEPSIWVTILYRLTRILFLINIPIFKYLMRIAGFFIYKFTEIVFGVSIPPGTNIGPGLYIGHTGSIRINYDVIAGKNLNIGLGVIIGHAGFGRKGVPVLGDNVFVGTGAKVLGNIKIGNNVRIGANAFVVKDVPDNATAVGVPARIIKTN